MTALTLTAWDAAWQDLYDRGRIAGLTPNAAIARAERLMDARHGSRPVPVETPKETAK